MKNHYLFKWITIICLILFQVQVMAQVNVSIQILPPYPTKFTDYASKPHLMVISITNTSTTNQKIQLRGTVTGDNGIVIRVRPSYKSASAIELGPGQTRMLNGNDVAYFFDYNKLEYSGITQNDFINKGGLPEGRYQLCIRAFDYDTNAAISADEPSGCSNSFSVASLEPPIILSPRDEEVVSSKAGQIIQLRWNTPVGTPPGIQYRVRIVEVLGNRNPNDAMATARQPYFYEKVVMTNMEIFDPASPQLTPGRKYAMMVQSIDPSNEAVFRNQGKSEVISFTYGIAEEPVIVNQPGQQVVISGVPNCDCKEAISNGVSNNANVKVNTIITVNKFKMNVLEVIKQPNNLLSGIGTIALPFLNSGAPGAKLRVQFSDLDVDGQMKMKAGSIEGVVANQVASLFPKIADLQNPTIPMGSSEAKSLNDFFTANAQHMIAAVKNSGNASGFELPLGISSPAATIAIGRVYFNAAQAWFDAATVIDIPDGGDVNVLGLSGRNICLNAENLCNGGKMYLSENLDIPYIHLRLNRPGENLNTKPGTFITFDKNGFQKLTIDAEYTFPDGTILDAETNSPIKANLVAKDVDSWGDWVAELSLPKFYVQGMQTIKFDLAGNKMYYDHSDFKKPNGIPNQFSATGQTPINTGELTWKGFYIPKIKVMMPEIFKSVKKVPVSFEATNIIIDNGGLTGSFSNTGKVLEIGDGSMDGWYASIDKVNLSFFKSGFKESKINGKIVLPGSNHDSEANQLNYEGTLTTSSESGGLAYSFYVTQKNDITLDALFVSVNLYNSEIAITGGANQAFTASALLNGKLSLSNDPLSKVKVPGLGLLHFPEVSFSKLQLMTQAPFINKDSFSATLNSPQKGLAGFEFTGSATGFNLSAATPKSVDIGLSFTGGLELAGDGLGCEAKTSFTLTSEFKKEDDRIVWKGIGGRIDDIALAANASLGPLTIKGAIKYYNDVANKDEGFVGALETNIATMLTVNMRARFGTKADNAGKFNYFEFNAMADLGQTGITLAPLPIAVYGFGGGIYYNMTLDEKSIPKAEAIPVKPKVADVDDANMPKTAKSDHDPKSEASAMDLLNFNPANLVLKPQRGGFGLQATILFGLTSRNTLDMDATFSMGFVKANDYGGGGGISHISLNGHARILTDVSKPLSERRAASTGAGDIEIKILPQDKTFLANLNFELGLPTVEDTKLLHIKGGGMFYRGPEGWFLKIGQPEGSTTMGPGGPNTVNILSVIEGQSYMEVGTYIDDMPPIPQAIKDIIGEGNDQKQNRTLTKTDPGTRTYSPASGKGLIFGSNVSVGDPDTEYKFLMFYGKFFAMMGFDISVNPDVSCDGVANAGGPGGWYAKGQAYFGAKATLGIDVDLFLFSGKIEIFDAGVAAVVQAGLPKPAWVMGTVGGHYSVLDGAISGRFNFGFSVGEKCVNSNADAFGGIQLISQVSPASTLDPPVPINTIPSVVFNLKAGGEFDGGRHINGYFEFDDFEKADKNGNPTKRYFLFDKSCITATLNGANVTSSLKRFPNDEYSLYVNRSEYLQKETEYKFEVIAKMKEGFVSLSSIGQSLTPQNYRFINVKGSNTDAEQRKESVFKTDRGFTSIPSSEYAFTAPLHSHKSVPTKQYGLANNQQLLEFKKKIDPLSFFAYPEGTTYSARVFRNGIKTAQDFPIIMGTSSRRLTDEHRPTGDGRTYDDSHAMWSFIGPQLEKSSAYTVLLIAKTPTTGLSGSGTATNTTNYSSGESYIEDKLVSGIEINAKVRTIGNQVNTLRSNEHIVGGFSYSTSAFDTYEAKFIGEKITKVLNSTNNQFISSSNSALKNKEIFAKMVPPVNGKYAIKVGDIAGFNFPVDVTLNGELFSKADRYNTTSNDIFLPDYSNSQISINAVIKSPNVQPDANYGTDYIKLRQYISGLTGISVNDISVTMNKSNIPLKDVGEVFTYQDGGGYIEFTAATSNLGQKLPTELPEIKSLNSTYVDNINSNYFNGLSFFDSPAIVIDRMRASYIGLGSRGQMTFTDAIQRQVDKVKNWAVNPADNIMVNLGSGLSNVAVWETVSTSATGLMKGTLNQVQVQQNIKGAVQGIGRR
ncbi:MAG: hypothetical protein EOO47_03275 [Flavobacterium sp.]|nr:MAG: hypothetical protein EOO47_03275 [Flavobacterium sp.]